VDGLPREVITHDQLQVERRTGNVRRSQTDVLPLCHATNSNNKDYLLTSYLLTYLLFCACRRRRSRATRGCGKRWRNSRRACLSTRRRTALRRWRRDSTPTYWSRACSSTSSSGRVTWRRSADCSTARVTASEHLEVGTRPTAV